MCQQTRKIFHVKLTLFSFLKRTWEDAIWSVAADGILSNFYWTWPDCDMAIKVSGLVLNNGLSAVPIFLASLVFPCPGFRAPVFAMSFRGSTNSRGKIWPARSLVSHVRGNAFMSPTCATKCTWLSLSENIALRLVQSFTICCQSFFTYCHVNVLSTGIEGLIIWERIALGIGLPWSIVFPDSFTWSLG